MRAAGELQEAPSRRHSQLPAAFTALHICLLASSLGQFVSRKVSIKSIPKRMLKAIYDITSLDFQLASLLKL